ncbi:MAG TPA: type II secretion system protein [Actinomycetota bacterium]|nr:type II secretion system protein [Actinomycetota bacterium]
MSMRAFMDRREGGFTLIETLVALTIFGMVTIGIVPIVAFSIRSSSVARSHTIAKNFAAETMERIRGLPYFESVKGGATPKRQDVIDLYFPDRLAGSGGSGYGAGNTYTTICSTTAKLPVASAAQACPANIPAGYTVTLKAQFVKPGTITAGTQSFTVATVPVGYSWSTVATETPPAQMLQMNLAVTWTSAGNAKSFEFSSLIGPRQASVEALRGSGSVDFVIKASTGFADAQVPPRTSTLTATLGESESSVSVRGVAGADHSAVGGQLHLSKDEYTDALGTIHQAETVWDLFGINVSRHGPPTSGPSDTTASSISTLATHPDTATQVGFLEGTMSDDALVQVVNELPKASGAFRTTGPSDALSGWINNQAVTGTNSTLKLEPTRPIVELRALLPSTGYTGRLGGTTAAEAIALTDAGGGKVTSRATAEFGRLNLFPTTFTKGDITERGILVIRDFKAEVSCAGVAGSGTPVLTGSWSAKIKYWTDDNNGNSNNGKYSVEKTISGNTDGTGTPLSIVEDGGNPRVYDDVDDTKDLFLFRTPTTPGYLDTLATTTGVQSRVTPDGSTTSVNLTSAIHIQTAPTNPAIPGSTVSITIGKLSCEAVDAR